MRKFTVVFGLLLLILGGWLVWRRAHPPLTDEEQIAAAIDAITSAADHRQVRGIANYLTSDFKFGGTGKKDFQNSLVGAMWQYGDVDLDVSGVKVEVKGKTATSDGHYTVNLKRDPTSSPESYFGNFKLQWRKENGNWLVSRAEGGPPMGDSPF